MIDFTRSFNVAWERMHLVLFRPFDLGKWFAIGFSAFLAGLLEGGNGASFNLNVPNNRSSGSVSEQNVDMHAVMEKISNAFTSHLGFIIWITVCVIVFAVVVVLLIYWLGSRGEFMILDNIVRNRGAIAWPWSYYARQANSLFGFYLLFGALSLVVFLPLIVALLYLGWELIKGMRAPTSFEISLLVFFALAYVGFALVLGVILFIFREFGIPIMFRQGVLARSAFVQALDLAAERPGSVAVFILLRFVIFIGVVILAALACCFTCCIAALPYLGTVILLPVLIYVRCFTLECLAQFGPQYNVWTVEGAVPNVVVAPVNPQPPRG
jgi:hypothetical protein